MNRLFGTSAVTNPLASSMRAFLCGAALCLSGAATVWAQAPAEAAASEPPPHDYPTLLRVEYVQECINVNGGAFALLYQCSCALDKLRTVYPPDDFVEVTTFAKYAALPGERGGEFRDSDRARSLVRKFRAVQSEAYKSCNVVNQPRPSAPAR